MTSKYIEEKDSTEELKFEKVKKEITESIKEDVDKIVNVATDLLSDIFIELAQEPEIDVIQLFEKLKKEYDLTTPWLDFSDKPIKVSPTYLVNIPIITELLVLTRSTQEFEVSAMLERRCMNCKHVIGVTIPLAPTLTPTLPIRKGCTCEKPEIIQVEKGSIPCVSGLAVFNYMRDNKEVKLHIEYVAIGRARTEVYGGRNKVLGFITKVPKKKKESKVYAYRFIILHVFRDQETVGTSIKPMQFSLTNIIQYFAPMVIGYEDKKLLLLLQLIGAGCSTLESVNQRFWINLLMIGDPSTAKSILAREVARVFRKVSITSLTGSTIPGLFAGKVEGNIQFGPLVLLDGDGLNHGILILSECEKITDRQQKELLPVLLQAMEDGYVSRNIAGIELAHTTRCGILFVSNWKNVYYMPNQSFIENLPSLFTHGALLDRIDAFVLFKQPPPDILKEIMRGLLSKFERGSEFKKEVESCRKTISALIESARRKSISITADVKENVETLIDNLMELLAKYSIRSIDARRVMSLIRLGIAFTKLTQRNELTYQTIEKIYDLLLLQIKLVEDTRALLFMFARTEKSPSLLKFYMDFYDFLLSIASEKDGKYIVDLVTIMQRFRQYLDQLSMENPHLYDNIMYIVRQYFNNRIERAIEETLEYLRANGLVVLRDPTNKVYEVVTSFDEKLKDMFSFSKK